MLALFHQMFQKSDPCIFDIMWQITSEVVNELSYSTRMQLLEKIDNRVYSQLTPGEEEAEDEYMSANTKIAKRIRPELIISVMQKRNIYSFDSIDKNAINEIGRITAREITDEYEQCIRKKQRA
jgi:hypothetical protein